MIKNIEYIFFNVKFSITIICFKFTKKYLLTSNEVKKFKIFNLTGNSDKYFFYFTFNDILKKRRLLCGMFLYILIMDEKVLVLCEK